MGRPKIILTQEDLESRIKKAREVSANYYRENAKEVKERRAVKRREEKEKAKRDTLRTQAIEAVKNNIAIFGKDIVMEKAGEIRHILAFDLSLEEITEIINNH